MSDAELKALAFAMDAIQDALHGRRLLQIGDMVRNEESLIEGRIVGWFIHDDERKEPFRRVSRERCLERHNGYLQVELKDGSRHLWYKFHCECVGVPKDDPTRYGFVEWEAQ